RVRRDRRAIVGRLRGCEASGYHKGGKSVAAAKDWQSESQLTSEAPRTGSASERPEIISSNGHLTAVDMISTPASAPISAVPTVARAGKSLVKIPRYAAFMSGNVVMSGR